MRDREAFEAWFESQLTEHVVALAVASANRSVAVYYGYCDPEEYMRDLFSNDEYSGALKLAEEYSRSGDCGSLKSLVDAIDVLRTSTEFLEGNVDEASGGADVVDQRRRALFACKAVQHAVVALVWPRGSEHELSQCYDPGEKRAREENGARHHARLAIELATMALRFGLMSFLISMGVSGLK